MSDSSSDRFPPRPRRDSVILHARVEAVDRVAECRVRNLSESGACIDDPAGLPSDGRVLVTMGTLHHVEGRVRWAQDGRAGLHFAASHIDVAAARRPRGTVAPAPQNRAGWLANLHSPYRRGDD
ncbi:PilZ domain-containing protein [Sphingomonas sp. 2R-10]|uniref:PilZ domain-containing protein n=1 Tax=Sphingomonas sp. 2R-10 TaxID=3045148 RepID=UPI000F7B6F1E|nr:PilZ domain-containing protein [Sphingomonas sp. 2R-10]MDJ0276107.1 PilZ domain-containing protein [Sphingomonas sp. 2R-10]